MDVTYQDKDGIENRERVEPEQGLAFDTETRQIKKKKHSMPALIAEPFIRENTVRDLVYMDRLEKMARGFSGTGMTDPLENVGTRLDKTKLRSILPRIQKEMEATMPKADEMESFFKESTIKGRVKAKMGTGTAMPPKNFLMRETEREAFLLDQDWKIGKTRKEISDKAADAESRKEITKKVDALREERARKIREWMEAKDEDAESPTASGALSGT